MKLHPDSSSRMRMCACLCIALLSACPDERIIETRRVVSRDGVDVAQVVEVVRPKRSGGLLVQRTAKRSASPSDDILSLATLDAQGFALTASFRREGPGGKRYVELMRKDGVVSVVSRGDGETAEIPADARIVLTETLRHLSKQATGKVLVLDLENAVIREAVVNGGVLSDDHGPFARGGDGAVVVGLHADRPAEDATPPPLLRVETGAGAASAATWQPPTPADPVLLRHRRPEPFIEAKTPAVVRFAKSHGPALDAAGAAAALHGALLPRLTDEFPDAEPSALAAVTVRADVAGTSALFVAAMRSLGHPARLVTGDVMIDGAPRERTWAEFHDGGAWVVVDVGAGGAAPVHLPLVEGFASPVSSERARLLLPARTPGPAPAAP